MNRVEVFIPFATSVFLLTVAVIVVVWLVAVARARSLPVGVRAGSAILVVAGWVVLPAVLAASGALNRYDPLPAPPLVLIAVLSISTCVLMLSPLGSAIERSTSLTWLVGFQVFRIAVEWWLHHAFLDGFIPVQMTWAGRNFDVVSGLTAFGLALWMSRGRPPRWVLWAWNVLGLGLLANIVGVAIFSTPTSFRLFLDGPPNLVPSTFPFIWLATVLVQAALAGHVLMFRALARRRAL